MKHLKTIFACLLMAVLSIGQVWAVEATIANTNNSGSCEWTDGTATITQVKWAGSTSVNSTYATNLRVYGGHVLLFDAGEGNTWKSFEYQVATTYYGKTVKWGSSANAITSSNYSSATDGTGTLVSSSGGSSTLSFTAGRYAYIYNSATSSPVQLRITSFTATYEKAGSTPVAVTGVSLNKNATSIEVGANETLTATIAPANATNKNVSWTSSNTSVATVSNGTVTAVAAGNANITVTTEDGSFSDVCAVTVTAAKPKITITQDEVASFTNAYAQYTWTAGGVSGKLYAYKNSGMQFNSGKDGYYVYNTDPIPGKIRKIAMTKASGTTRSWTPYVSTSAMTSASGDALTAKEVASTTTWDVTGDNSYFYLTVAGGSTVISSIVITYEEVNAAVTVATPATGTGTLEVTGAADLSAVSMGTELTVEATPSATYHGGTVKVVKTGVTPEADVTSTVYNAGTGKLTMPDYDITVSATFVADAAISVAVAAGQTSWGSVKLYNSTPAEVSSGTTFKPAAGFKIEATPASSDYEFVSWAKSAGSDIILSDADAIDNDPTLTAGEVSTTFTATFRETAKPYLTVDPASLSFGPIAVNGSQNLTFELTAENLTEDASLAISGTGAAMFSVASSVAKDGSGAINTNVTVTYNPTAAGTHTATLTISSEGATPVEVALSGEAKTNHAITWSVNGAALSGAALDGVTTSVLDGGNVTALPADPADNTLACANTFMGWSRHNWNSTPKTASDYDDLFKAPAGAGTIEESTTFYAVFATVNNGSDQDNDGPSWSRPASTDTYTDGYTFSASASGKSGYYQDASSGTGDLKLYHTTTPIFSSTPKSVTLTANIGGGSGSHDLGNSVYAQLLDKDGNGIGTAIEVTNYISDAAGDTYTPSFDLTTITSAYGVMLYHAKESGYNVRYFSFSLSFVTSGTTITNYITKCAAVVAPTFDPAAGEYSVAQDVTIASATDGAKVYYTLTTDGSTPADPTALSTEATSAVTVNQNSKIKAIAIKGEDKSDIVSAEYTFKVTTPEIEGSTSFVGTATVTITATGADAIYYTDDDSDPASSGTRKIYSDPFTVDATTTIKAIATKTNWTNSAVATQTFTRLETLTVAEAIALIPNQDDVANDKYVAGVVCTAGTSVNASGQMTYHISADGSETNRLQIYLGKNLNNTAFSSASDLSVGDRVVVFGQLKNYKGTYEMNSGNYLVLKEGPAVATPVFTPDGGGFMGETDVTITCATASNTIYYTTDGTTPSKSSTEYTAAIHLDATTTITAIAYVDEEHSIVVAKTFTLTAPMTVDEALAALDSEDPINNAAVTGIISTAPSSNPSSGRLTYYISDDGTTTSELEVYNGFGLNGAAFSAKTDLQEGDQVTVFGNLTIYNTTKEFSAGSRMLAFTRPTVDVTGVTVASTANVRAERTVALTAEISPANATDKVVTWESDAEGVATVDANGVVTGVAEGTAHITVTTHDGGFTATCTVTVAGALPTFTEDDHEWIKITNASKLVAGRYYVIGESSKGKTATTSISSSVMGQVGSTFADGRIASDKLGTNTAIFELGGNSTDGWTLYEVTDEENTGYFSGANAASFGWSESAAVTPISFDENGNAVLGNASGYRLLYNSGSPRFKTYNSATSSSMLLPQLYMWAELSHAVTFDANGGVAESVPGVERTDEGKITIPETEPTHSDVAKVFAGWFSAGAPNVLYNAGDEFSTSVNITLYAKWNTVPTYTVTYVPGGSGTVPAVASYPAGKKVLVETNVSLSNPGYSFTGWTVKDADQNVLPVDEDNKFTMPAKNVTIVAGWARISNQKWVLVENVADLKTDGTKYIIAGAEHNVGMGALNGSIYNSVGVTKDGKNLKGPEMTELTFEAGSEGKLAIKHGSKYVYSTSAKSIGERDASFEWTISISEGVATIDAGSAGTLQYNSGSPRFTTYTSNQKPVAIYIKSASVVVTNEQDVSGISAGADVTVEDGGVLNVDADKTIGDLTVENGGKVVLDANKLTVVGTFTIETTMASGNSGQLTGATASNFAATGEAYIDITLGAGARSDQWHAFTVPFPVDAINGVFDLDGTQLINETNYAIMEYLGDVRATGAYGWKKIRTTLVPGTFYLMTVDGLRTTYRFKKVADAAIVAGNSKSVSKYAASGEGTSVDAGWNGVGNPTLTYGKVDAEVQVLDPVSYTYIKKDANSTNFVVGTPFFYQAAADGSISMVAASGTTNYAPHRVAANGIEKIKVAFGNEDFTDYLDISASEEATNEYVIGKDLAKMMMTSTPRVAQIYGKAYGTNLCMIDAPLVNNQAEYKMTLYVPEDGEYAISAPASENAEVYLTKDGAVIWNLSMSEYTHDFAKGFTTGYGLLLQAKAPMTPTGMDAVQGGKAQTTKIIIDEHVYILRGEKMYDATGRLVK